MLKNKQANKKNVFQILSNTPPGWVFLILLYLISHLMNTLIFWICFRRTQATHNYLFVLVKKMLCPKKKKKINQLKSLGTTSLLRQKLEMLLNCIWLKWFLVLWWNTTFAAKMSNLLATDSWNSDMENV